ARIGILQPAAFPDGALGDVRQIVEDPFFSAIETTLTDRAAAALLCKSDMLVDVDAATRLYAHNASLCSLDTRTRDPAIELACESIDAACALGASRVSIISGCDPGAVQRSQAMEMLVDSIDRLYAHARASLQIALKMADRAVDKRALIGPTLEGVEIARRVRQRHPGFGLILNLAHLPLLDEEPCSAVEQAAPYLARVDIGNCVKALGDTHPPFGVVDSK